MKRRSTALQAKFVADGVVDTLRRCGAGGVHFVCCLIANQPAEDANDLNVPLLRSQVFNFCLLAIKYSVRQKITRGIPYQHRSIGSTVVMISLYGKWKVSL